MKMKRIASVFKFLFVLSLIPGSVSINASENPRVGSIREFYRSIRAMGMGNAYMSSVRSCEALYYNPAALGRLRRSVSGEILNPQCGMNRRAYSLATKFSKLLSDNEELVDYMQEQVGHPQYGSFMVTPSVCYRGIGFGVFEIAEFESSISNVANPLMDIYVRNDYGFVLGGAYKMFGGRIKIGVSLKYIERSEVEKTVTADEFASDNFDLEEARAGSAIAIDTAMMWTIPMAFLPRFSVVLENTGDTYFTKKTGSLIGDTVIGQPYPMKQKLHVGLGLSPKLTSLSKININFEVRDSLRDTEDFYRLIHAGAEIVMPHLLRIRTGFNQGYLTYGFTLDFKYSKFEFASYGQEMGAYAGQKEDTRYMVKYILGF